MSKTGTALENGRGTLTTAMWGQQKRLQERKSSLAEICQPPSVKCEPGLKRWSDGSPGVLGMLRRDGPGRGGLWRTLCWDSSTMPCPAGQARNGPHSDRGLTLQKQDSRLFLTMSLPSEMSTCLPDTCLVRALTRVSVQTSAEMAKIIQAELLIVLVSVHKHLLRVNSMC